MLNRPPLRLTFSRALTSDKELRYIRQKMESAVAIGKAFLTTPDSAKCSLLVQVECMIAKSGVSGAAAAPNLRSAEEISQILAIFKGSPDTPGAVIIDEVDSVLDPIRSELNFPIGEVS